MKRGRLREFWQCDFDIAGVYDAMIPDAEILRIIVEVFRGLEMDVTIKVNHRKILDGLFAVCGVPPDQVRSISSSVDKLDKLPWADVKKEMVDEKGLAEEVAERIGQYVNLKGSMKNMLERIKSDAELCSNSDVVAGLNDLTLLSSYLEAMNVQDDVSFDLSLARGLDYYTGFIYEVISQDTTQVGSIAGGGRYDNLVGMYGKAPIPCVGLSFGIDRIFTILDSRRQTKKDDLAHKPDVYIITVGGSFLLERMSVACKLWDAGIQAEYSTKVTPKLFPQWKASEGALIGVILGKEEMDKRLVRVKDLRLRDTEGGEKERGKLVLLDDLVEEVQVLLERTESGKDPME